MWQVNFCLWPSKKHQGIAEVERARGEVLTHIHYAQLVRACKPIEDMAHSFKLMDADAIERVHCAIRAALWELEHG